MSSYSNNTMHEFAFQLDEFYLDLQEDGSKISILDKEKIEERPFPGLRPFKTSEFQLFKGRDGQAEELIKRLKKNHFLAVIGSSGTGKSSLVRAGLIPQLFGGYLQVAGNKWNIAISRPGKDPVENLAIALSSIKGHSKERSHVYENYESIGPQLNSSIYGILEVDELLNAGKQKEEKPNLLIIIDQFEELFRFDRKDLNKKNIENHFVNLLLKASLNPNSSVYVIITMRSEFLGDCVKYRGLPEAINEGQYLVPQLTRNQVKEVIEGPINLAGKKISPGLVELLINEIEESKLKENLDQLPILQHALMRTYLEAMKHGADTEICYEHYKEIGEMDKALANHAEAKFTDLGEGTVDNNLSKKQQIAKIIFQALTDASTDQKGGRRPTELKNIYAIARSINASEAEVDEVINHFRDIDTSFIMPPINPDLPNTGLYPDLIMDISHESLMRNWERLNKWIDEEVRFGKLYKTLNERRELNEEDKSELIRGVLLRELLDWKARYSNNLTWASRYHQIPKNVPGRSLHEELYRKNLAFLDESEAAGIAALEAEQQQLKKEIERQQRERSRKKVIAVFAGATIISLCFGLWAFSERANATKSALKAIQEEKLAETQTALASEAEKKARQQEQYAMLQRDSALIYARQIMDLKEQAKKDAVMKIALAEKLRVAAEGQTVNLEKQLVKSEVQKQGFYASNFLSAPAKDSILRALFKNSLDDLKVIPPSKYVNMELLADVNKTAEARELILHDPIQGLRNADSVWTHISSKHQGDSKNKVVENIIFDIFKKNAFPVQEIKPGSYTPSLIAVTKDYTHFAMDNLNAITVGSYEKDTLSINHRYTNQIFDVSFSDYFIKSTIIALSYRDNNKVLTLQDNGKIMEWEQGKIEIATLPGINNATIARFSPDGNLMVTLSKEEGIMKVWNIPELKKGKSLPYFTDTTARNRYVKQIDFSPDSKRLLKLYNTGKMEVWNIEGKSLLPGFNTYRIINAANFCPDSNYVLTVSADNYLSTFDSQGKEINVLSLYNTTKANTDYTFSRINYLSLSPDWKKMIFTQEGGEAFVVKRAGNDSIISLFRNIKTRQPNSLLPKKLIGFSAGIKKALFYAKDNIITIDDNGIINLWDAASTPGNLNEAFSGINKFIALTFDEKLASGLLSFEEINHDTNKKHLNTAALYYYGAIYNGDPVKRNSYIDTTLFLYKKLADTDTGSLQKDGLNKTVSLLSEFKDLEINKEKPNYHLILKRLNEIVAIEKTIKGTDTTDKALTRSLANNYNDLAYYSLFAGDFPGAIPYALKGLEYEPSFYIIYTNLALAYLLDGQDKIADSLYLKFKDQEYDNGGILTPFKDGFLQDFKDFIEAGVIAPDDKRVKRIKKILGE